MKKEKKKPHEITRLGLNAWGEAPKKSKQSISGLVNFVDYLHNVDAIHVRRGFRLSQGTPLVASNHLIEEVAELQAEVIADKPILEEAGDVLVVFLHLIKVAGLKLDDIADAAYDKLLGTFTLNPKKVTAKKPGITRKGRS